MLYVIKRPIVTEKNTVLNAMGVYVFEVDRKATKTEIKEAVEKSFSVKVKGVRTALCRGRGRRTKLGYSQAKYWKKALIQLQPGEKIALFEGA